MGCVCHDHRGKFYQCSNCWSTESESFEFSGKVLINKDYYKACIDAASEPQDVKVWRPTDKE